MNKDPIEVNGHVLNWHPNQLEHGDWRCNLCGERFLKAQHAATLGRCAGWLNRNADPLAPVERSLDW